MYEDKTPESIKADIVAGLDGMDCSEGSYVDLLISPIAYEIWKYYTAIGAVEPIVFVDEGSGAYIDQKCADYGMTRKPGVKATVSMSFSGDNGTVLSKGKAFMTKTGLTFLLVDSVTIVDGTGSGVAEAEAVGSQYNIGRDTLVAQTVLLPGLESWSNESASGGTNPETDEELVKRLYDRLRNPATSGNVAHYKEWATETPGVGNCRVLPLWDGAGTVKLVVVDSEGKVASEAILEDCQAHVEEMRPIGAAVTVESATAVTVSVTATVTLDNTTTLEEVKTAFNKALDEYLRSIAFEKNEVQYSRIAFMLLDTAGVHDYSDLMVNEGTINLTLTDTEIPVRGETALEIA